MRIVEDNALDGTIKVSELSIGEVFYIVNITDDRIYYMKVFHGDLARENSIIAVNLETGFIIALHNDARVHKCNDAVLHIDYSTTAR